jgi:hypothetical protein
VNVRLRSTDAHGVPWQASAAYRADPGGDVDLSTAAAISGSYHGISDMGLIWSMHALKPDPAGAYFWGGDTPLAFTLAVSAHGTQVASASFQRKFSAGTPTPAPDTRLGHSSLMSQLPPSQTLTTPPTSRHAHCYGPICSPFSPG